MRTTWKQSFPALAVSLAFAIPVGGQTSTKCNPLTSTCPDDPALGKSISIDFTKGSSDQFTAQGSPSYDGNGASFTIAKSGDSSTIVSNFYLMFGKVEVVMKAAPGQGIVSSFVMQSDDLDEIDYEWVGSDTTQVQSNYFGKGQTTTYDRGAFHSDPTAMSSFNTYTIDWSANQINWEINGQTVRTLQPSGANGQYPQTPMQIKIGIWSGGDPSNAPGTITWAGGPTNYAGGPYTMVVKSLTATDYSTGTAYKYNGHDGTWQEIVAVGGTVNPSGSGAPAASAQAAPSVTSASPSVPAFDGTHRDSSTTTPTGYPWVSGSTTLLTSASAAATSYPGLPAGWTVSGSGKSTDAPPPTSSSASPSVSDASAPTSSAAPSSSITPATTAAPSSGDSNLETVTQFNQQGFSTLVTESKGASTASKSFNEQGFTTSAALAMMTPTKNDANPNLRNGGMAGAAVAAIVAGALAM